MKTTRTTQRPRLPATATTKKPTAKKPPASAPKRPATSRLLHDYIRDAVEPAKKPVRKPNLDPTLRNVDVNERQRRTHEQLFGPQR